MCILAGWSAVGEERVPAPGTDPSVAFSAPSGAWQLSLNTSETAEFPEKTAKNTRRWAIPSARVPVNSRVALFVTVSTGSPKKRSNFQPASIQPGCILAGWTMQIAYIAICIRSALGPLWCSMCGLLLRQDERRTRLASAAPIRRAPWHSQASLPSLVAVLSTCCAASASRGSRPAAEAGADGSDHGPGAPAAGTRAAPGCRALIASGS